MPAESRGPGRPKPDAPRKPSGTGSHTGSFGDHVRQPRQGSRQTSCFLGLETRPELLWEDWDPGKEFTKTLMLKNIQSRPQKLHLRPPESKIFSIQAPRVITVCPGNSYSLQITFKPALRCEYEDNIEFQSKDGSFQVCLHAIIPRHVLEVPESVLLPLCAVQHSVQSVFLLKNVSKLQTWFQWECAGPFKLSPAHGLLKSAEVCHITVVFQPQEALVYQQHGLCRFGEEGNLNDGSYCTVLLQGLAKYPCLQLRHPCSEEEPERGCPVLEFGAVAVGQRLQKHFEIYNPSPVTASFSLSRPSGGVPLLGSEFICDVTKGEVAPSELLRVTVTFSPTVVNTVSFEYVSLKCKGALNKPLINLTGTCIGPKLALSSPVIDFGCTTEGGAVEQVVRMVNASPVEAVFQWDIDCSGHSVFSIRPATGTLHPLTCTTVKAYYKPYQPNTHHRRVACLVLHQDPLLLDLFGTCHSNLQQAVRLKPECFVSFTPRSQSREEPPDSISQDHDLDQSCSLEELKQRPESAAVKSVTPVEDYYQSCFGHMDPQSSFWCPHLSVVPNELLFNHKQSSLSPTSSASSQAVCITNYTGVKLSLVWTLMQDSPFSVIPSSCVLGPLKATAFRVNYDPKELNTLHGAQLECFAYYKQDDGKERLLYPPWCVTVRVIGHSFQLGKEHFSPRWSLRPDRVVFPGLRVLSYRTALLCNTGDLPLTFWLSPPRSSNPASAESVFLVPGCSFIPPGGYQILTLRATPSEDSPEKGFILNLQLNATQHTQELTVLSRLEKLSLCLEGEGSLHFQPTFLGSWTQRSHHIRNLCSFPLQYQWSIPELDQELIHVEPDSGELQPNESVFERWSFSPLAEKTYILKPMLTFWPIQTSDGDKSHLNMRVVGAGSKGSIEAESAVLDMGETVIGSYRSISVPLLNNSPCSVSFCLSVQQKLLDEQPLHGHKSDARDLALELDRHRATIAAHSKMLLRCTFRPHRRAQYQWTISYQTLSPSDAVLCPPGAVCEVRAQGVFPTLQVADTCCGGSVARLSKKRLWKLFSLDSLNHQLLSPSEVTTRSKNMHSQHFGPTILTKTILDFNFSAAPLNSDPSYFNLMFHNPGCIPVDWTFLFPEDQQIELQYWAETGEFSNTELHHMRILEDHLFDVFPRSGTLLPGQQRAVQFSFRNEFTGMHQFPIVFKLSHGREILLNFQGLTVERNRPYLHFPDTRHIFDPVTIGDLTPPLQVYEIYNAGAILVYYEVDTTILTELQVDNFNHPVLCCLNPMGEVLPGRAAMLEFIFSPLEARTYHMDIPIHVRDGDSTLVRFEGQGLDSAALASSKQMKRSEAEPSETCVQRMPFPEQVVFLSEDSVCLGDIPVRSQSSRLLFLTNLSCRETVRYTWDLVQQGNQQVVQIRPKKGILCPGESVLCVLTFTSTEFPAIYQLDIICQLTQEAELARYHDALQCWEQERDRQQNEFTDFSQSHWILTDPMASVEERPPLRKYKILPPICTVNCDKSVDFVCSKRREQREKAKEWRRPEPPKPAQLHLRVTAHSHGTLEYLTHFPDLFNKHHRRSFWSHRPQRSPTPSSSSSVPTGRQLPTQILVEVLTALFGDILNDEAFVHSLISLSSKPNLYARRISSSLSSPLSLSPPTYQPLIPLDKTKAELENQHDTLKTSGGAGGPDQVSKATISLSLKHVPVDMCEDILLNTLQNLMVEAVRGELDLTAHPRSIVKPPLSARNRRVS